MDYLIANWKANDSLEFAKIWFDKWNINPPLNNIITIVCPSFPILDFVSTQPSIVCGAQDLATSDLSQFAKYCIVGHSQRRRQLGESLETIKSKMETLIGIGITPIMCFEDSNDLIFVKDYISKSILVYEPSENISSHGQFKEVDFNVLSEVAFSIKSIIGHKISLLYGGSVNIGNVLQIRNLNVFNGVLVGKASLDALEFYEIGKVWAKKA